MLLHVPSAFVFDAEFAHLLFPRSTAVGRLTVTEWVTKRAFTQVSAIRRDCGKPAGFGWIAATPGSDKAGFYAMGAIRGIARNHS